MYGKVDTYSSLYFFFFFFRNYAFHPIMIQQVMDWHFADLKPLFYWKTQTLLGGV